MTPKEVIKKTIHFEKPERLGLYYLVGEDLHSDIYLDHPDTPKFEAKKRIDNNFELWEDVWGNTWARVVSDQTTTGEVTKGAIDDWDKFESYNIPDLANKELYVGMAQRFSDKKDMYKIAEMDFCFAIARTLRGLDNLLMDVKLEKEKLVALLKHIEDLYADIIDQCAKAGADGILFYEDWGTQHQLFVHPDDWVELFKPYFSRLCGLAHKNNLNVWLHSCGYIYSIIPHLIEVGIDVLQLDQPELMGIEKLGEEFAGKVTFWSPCDIQKVLPTGDKSLIENSIRRMFQNWCVNGGGLIAKSYGLYSKDLHSIGVKPEWNKFAYECFLKYGSQFYNNKTLSVG